MTTSSRKVLVFALVFGVLTSRAGWTQEQTLDVLDGETLYEGGWLFTFGVEHQKFEGLRQGGRRQSDPLDRERTETSAALAAHYGLRYDVQLSLFAPYETRIEESDNPTGPDRTSAEGLGDAAVVAKWRFLRQDGTGWATNYALLAGLEAPTGSDSERDHGSRVAADLQPGSGSWDPAFGAAVTHEPGRWRFNAAALYQHNGAGDHDYRFGDELFVEVAAGNRFWLEPYPGPFMRFDALLRYRNRARAQEGGGIVHDSGGEVTTAGATLAFRPRPRLDFQLFVEVPILQHLEGTQLEEDYAVTFVAGIRF